MQESSAEIVERFAHECRIRDAYARRLAEFRPRELLLRTEHTLADTSIRADMRTLDEDDVMRVWEFKIFAGYEGLGQILTYLSQTRKEFSFSRPVRAVLAAFSFQVEVIQAIEILNLGVEVVHLPAKLRLAGKAPVIPDFIPPPSIPLDRHSPTTPEEGK